MLEQYYVSELGKAWAAHLKSLVDHQQSKIIVLDFYQAFIASTMSNFIQGKTHRGLFFWLSILREAHLYGLNTICLIDRQGPELGYAQIDQPAGANSIKKIWGKFTPSIL